MPSEPTNLIDIEQGLTLWGDAVLYREFLGMFFAENANVMARLRAADQTEIHTIAHKLKGSAANVGLIALSRGAADLDQALRKEPMTEDIQAMLEQLGVVFRATQQAADRYMQSR